MGNKIINAATALGDRGCLAKKKDASLFQKVENHLGALGLLVHHYNASLQLSLDTKKAIASDAKGFQPSIFYNRFLRLKPSLMSLIRSIYL
ncbi:hypothetical protein AWQ21_13820 [Picosynechococcus sp. PCC 7003]|nr:hypothetical protein AWQ21_13820 [Picosynechococcus sp. PCC 7003]